MLLIFFILDLNDKNATNLLCFKLTPFQTLLSLNEHQLKIGLDSREHDDDCDLGSDLQLAGDAYELPTTHAPTMR